jgi:hypothetical protein
MRKGRQGYNYIRQQNRMLVLPDLDRGYGLKVAHRTNLDEPTNHWQGHDILSTGVACAVWAQCRQSRRHAFDLANLESAFDLKRRYAFDARTARCEVKATLIRAGNGTN